MERMKGGKFTNKMAFVRENYGEATLHEAIGSLDPADQAALKIVLDTAWYPIDLYDRLLVAIYNTIAGGDESVYTKMGYYSAEQTFTTTYKVFRGRNPEELISRIVSMHAMRNDPSKLKIVSQGEGHWMFRIIHPQSTPVICKVSLAFYVRAIQLCGATNVRGKETSCSGRGEAYCQYELTWD